MLLGHEKEYLLHLPTPLEYLPSVSADLGIELYIKRDDLTPLAMGGNKLRKLEYLLKDALDKMLDTSCSEEYEQELSEYIRKQEGVIRLDLLRTRMFGNKIYIDTEIAVDGDMTLKDAHDIAERVHDKVEQKFPNTKHIMIHVNPA